MKKDLYRLVTLAADGKNDTDSIVGVFTEMAAGRLQPDLTLLNYYHELPVCYRSTIASVDPDSIELLVHENQATVLKQENSTLIKSRHFPDNLAVHCYAAHVDLPKQRAVLHNFTYAQVRAERREAVRVKVIEPVAATFACWSKRLEGEILDISGSGISIASQAAGAFAVEEAGVIRCQLMGMPLEVTAFFVRSLPMAEADRHQNIFRIEPDRVAENLISKYICQRQVEIIQEIIDIKDGLLDEQAV